MIPYWVNFGPPEKGRHSEVPMPLSTRGPMPQAINLLDIDLAGLTMCRERMAEALRQDLGIGLTPAEKRDVELEWILSYLGCSQHLFHREFKEEYDLESAMFDLKLLSAAIEKAGNVMRRTAYQGKFPGVVVPQPVTEAKRPEVTILKNKGENSE
jgi:hypothetical protein